MLPLQGSQLNSPDHRGTRIGKRRKNANSDREAQFASTELAQGQSQLAVSEIAGAKIPKGMEGYLETGYFSDLTLMCDDRSWKLHKVIVCHQSKFFLKACSGDYTEAKTNTINLHDDDPVAVNALVQFFYKQQYDVPETVQQKSVGCFHVKVYNVADKYDVVELQEQAANNFRATAEQCWGCKDYAHVVKLLYNEGPSKSLLKSHMADLVAKHATELLVTESKISRAFIAAATNIPELGIDIARRLARKIEEDPQASTAFNPEGPKDDDDLESATFTLQRIRRESRRRLQASQDSEDDDLAAALALSTQDQDMFMS